MCVTNTRLRTEALGFQEVAKKMPPTLKTQIKAEKEIIAAFTDNETGTVVGYSLYSALNLTTQISKTITVMSSAIEGLTKSIRNVVVYQMPLKFSKEITGMIQGLEVLQNFNIIQDINYSVFLKYTEELPSSFNTNAFEEIISTKAYKNQPYHFCMRY